MDELGLDLNEIEPWFEEIQNVPFVLVRVPQEYASDWSNILSLPVRRCYVADSNLSDRSTRSGIPISQLIASKLPDPSSTMAGDFGEILVFIYHSVTVSGTKLIGPKKWRLKQDRTKAAPYSDVVHFAVPNWPDSSEQDLLLCSEVKTKSTSSIFSPISSAISDCEKDQTSRLAKTLVWLKERALHEDLGKTTIALLDRFISATDHPPVEKKFRAVAVVSSELLCDEIAKAPEEIPSSYTLVVIAVPDLKQTYESVFRSACDSTLAHEVDDS
jgi:hypothetical protein